MSAFDTAWMVLKMPPLPRGVQDVTGRIGEKEYGPKGSKGLSNQMAFNLGKVGGDADKNELRDFLLAHGDRPEVMDALAAAYGMPPGSIKFPGNMMEADEYSTMPMPDLPRGVPDMPLGDKPDANTVPPAPEANAGPPAPTGDVAVGPAPAPARDPNVEMLFSQFNDDQVLDEARRRGLL